MTFNPWLSRYGHWQNTPLPEGYSQPGIRHFFESAVPREWGFFIFALIVFFLLHLYLLDWPSTRQYFWLALFIWMAVAACYCAVVWTHMGASLGRDWLCGYFMELVFSMENVFIFHIIVEAFRTPRRQAQKALFIVVCCQVVFQMVFFMGLAGWLQSIQVLPYLLGVWLLYVGIQTGTKDDHGSFDMRESSMFQAFKACLGSRLSKGYQEQPAVLVVEDGCLKLTMLGPCIGCLLLADFVMEVDVTLTKIEGIQNHYVGFTSSVAAAFAMPTLFFVARDLFQRYAYLHHGITFVLIFFGCELLLHQVVHIPDMVGIVIIICVLALCIGLSKYFERRGPRGIMRRFSDESTISEIDNLSFFSREADSAIADRRLPPSRVARQPGQQQVETISETASVCSLPTPVGLGEGAAARTLSLAGAGASSGAHAGRGSEKARRMS